MKKVIEACIDRILEFDKPEEAEAYLDNLRQKEVNFRLCNRWEEGGKFRIRIQEQYNKSPLIKN